MPRTPKAQLDRDIVHTLERDAFARRMGGREIEGYMIEGGDDALAPRQAALASARQAADRQGSPIFVLGIGRDGDGTRIVVDREEISPSRRGGSPRASRASSIATIGTLRRAYARAVREELKYVDVMPERPTRRQLDAAWTKSEATTRALRALQRHPEYGPDRDR